MLERIIRFAIAPSLADAGADAGAGRRWASGASRAAADRRHAGHHQRPGADQHRGAGLLAAGSPSSASPSRSRRRWPACRGSTTRARCRATGCRRSRSSSRTAPTSTSRASRSPSACSRCARSCRAGVEPELGPIATGLGEIFMYTVEAEPEARKPDGTPWTATDLRTLQDWVVRPQLRNTPGVTEVNTIGGFVRQIHVTPDPARLVALGFTLHDVVDAVARNNQNVGAGYIERNGQQFLVRVPGQVADLRCDPRHRARPARRRADPRARRRRGRRRPGAAHRRGDAERPRSRARHGLHADRREQPRGRAGRGARSSRRSAPACRRASRRTPVYDRTALVDRTIATVAKNLVEGALLVIVVLFLLLGNFRAALITAAVIPLSMLFTVTGMVRGGVSGNLMSLGALDFGLIVDGAVIIVENCLRRFGEAQHAARPRADDARSASSSTATATAEVIRPSLFGVGIITAVYLPIFALTGVEGKMFHPMAITVVLALTGAMLLSLTFVPAAVALFLGGRVAEKENRVMQWAQPPLCAAAGAGRCARRALGDRRRAGAGGGLRAAGHAAGLRVHPQPRRRRHRGACVAHSRHQPDAGGGDADDARARASSSSRRSSASSQDRHRRGRHRPDAAVGRRHLRHAEAARATGPTRARPRRRWWRRSRPRVQPLPGNNYEFTQPIQMRMNELISGVRADVAVKVFGDDLDTLVERRRAHRGGGASGARRGRREARADHRPAAADRHARPRGAGRATASTRATCRTRWPPRSAARWPASCSKATGASTSSCACRKRCARIRRALADLPIPLPATARTPTSPAARQLERAARRASCRCARWRRSRPRSGPEPDQPRERQAPRRRHRQRARSRPRRLRRRTARARRAPRSRCRPATGSTTAARSSS